MSQLIPFPPIPHTRRGKSTNQLEAAGKGLPFVEQRLVEERSFHIQKAELMMFLELQEEVLKTGLVTTALKIRAEIVRLLQSIR